MQACASLEPNYQPPVTFIVVQKRHHTRLFANNHRDRNSTDRSGNILPGMLDVSELLIHANEFTSCFSLFENDRLPRLTFLCFWYAYRNCCWYQNLSPNGVWFLSLQSRWHPGKRLWFRLSIPHHINLNLDLDLAQLWFLTFYYHAGYKSSSALSCSMGWK
jgi:hypothetical protein